MIRIHFTYKHVDKPWGGANNFIRALNQNLQESGDFELLRSIEEPCDILFMNQLGTGPDGNRARISLRQVKRLLEPDPFSGNRRKLVVRAVNLNWHAFRIGLRNFTRGWWIDRQTVKLLNMADVAIFQSVYQRNFFVRAGYRGANDEVIHNGASAAYWRDPVPNLEFGDKLRLISSSASPRATKRHDLIARISLLEGVEVLHLGAWPKKLAPGRVKLLGMRPQEDMIRHFAECHYFLHPAIKDPCPNSIFEAICAGLPVIYNPDVGSSSEIVGSCGIALDEKNLIATLDLAKKRYKELRKTVVDHRRNYTILYAANLYRKIFERLVFEK